ncbi:cytochrome c oxidase assembly factor 1 homolog isoform X2 [Ovis canadensis]|uniref:cytochrome c oxidase assembly factor 1 homolog isoform X2 n=2 Tax=Ovis canadensis TaxID=37174 RepID=UPI0037505FC8
MLSIQLGLFMLQLFRATFLRWFSRKLGYEVAKSLGSRMPMPLGKQIFFAGVAASGGGAIVYYLVQKMFSRASYYQLALEQLHSHPEALEALGTPLNVHYLRLTDKYNFVDIADAKVEPSGGLLRAQGWSADSPVQAQQGQRRGEKGAKMISSLCSWPPWSPCVPRGCKCGHM